MMEDLSHADRSGRWCTLMIHSVQHSQEDVVLSPVLFSDWLVGGGPINIQILQDLANPTDRLVLCIPPAQTSRDLAGASRSSRVEISLSKTLAESFGLMPFARVYVDRVSLHEVEIDFVELAFRKQFLQRGNMWRFKKSMVSRAVYIGQNVSIDGIQATVQEVGSHGAPVKSGLISDRTHFIFRSRSTRIIWLVQISLEMWEFDQNGDLYFEKFLYKFAGPLLDRWKALATSHSLTVTFFCRTLYQAQDGASAKPAGLSTQHRSDGTPYVDSFKVVMENAADIDKVAFLKRLKTEFLAWPASVGWNIAPTASGSGGSGGSSSSGSGISSSRSGISDASSSSVDTSSCAPPAILAVPSDAPGGNFLEAINTTLNVLDKHYMDRDLQRTGNSIVVISPGTGFFRVQPSFAKITKQRMMDGGIGIDLVSLSQPPMHVVPLFQIDCQGLASTAPGSEISDFYEMPHWIAVSYVDCERDFFESFRGESRGKTKNRLDHRWTGLDNFSLSDDDASRGPGQDPWSDWRLVYSPPPFASYLNGHVRALAGGLVGQAGTLPLALPALLRWLLSTAAGRAEGEGEGDRSPDAEAEAGAGMAHWGALAPPPDKFKPHRGGARQLQPRPLPSLRTRNQPHPASNSNLDTPRRASGGLAAWSAGNTLAAASAGWGGVPGGRASVGLAGSYADPLDLETDGADLRELREDKHGDRHDRAGVAVPPAPAAATPPAVPTLSHSQPHAHASVPPHTQDHTHTHTNTHGHSHTHGADDLVSLLSRGGPDESAEALQGLMFAHDNIPRLPSALGDSCWSLSTLSASAHGSFSTPGARRRSTGYMPTAAERTAILSVAVPPPDARGGAEPPRSFGQPTRTTSSLHIAGLLAEYRDRNGQDGRDRSASQGVSPGASPRSLEERGSMHAFLGRDHGRPAPRDRDARHMSGNSQSLAASPGLRPSLAGHMQQQQQQSEGARASGREGREAVEEVLAYRARYAINPFKKEEGAMFLRTRTHNRRRWSHVFPWGWGDYTKNLPSETGFTGLNWKSLCQPAILPLTTDYIPQVPDLKNSYSNSSPYQLLLDGKCAFDSPESLLQEMVCQRLSQEFQLVEAESGGNSADTARPTFNPLPYFEYAMKTDHAAGAQAQTKTQAANAAATAATALSHPSQAGASPASARLFFILSMGHRIQFLFYEPSTRNVKVTQLTSNRDGRASGSAASTGGSGSTGSTTSYSYNLWVPQLGRYQAMQQHFAQFPNEFPWNKVDSILLGDGELDTGGGDSVRAKRLRFAVLPDLIRKEGDAAEYLGKLEKLVGLFQKYLYTGQPGDKDKEEMHVALDRDDASGPSAPRAQGKTGLVRLWLRPPHTATPKWVFLKYDAATSSRRVFHLELHWLVADSWLLDDFISVLFRRCSAWGLRIAQIPEFFCSANLQVHPFRGQPYVAVPLESRALPAINTSPACGLREYTQFSNTALLQALGYPSPVALVETLYFRAQSHSWIEDDSRATDWVSLRLPVPVYSAAASSGGGGSGGSRGNGGAGKGVVESGAGADAGASAGDSRSGGGSGGGGGTFSFLSRSISRPGTAAAMVNEAKRRRAHLDRQYMHRVGFACVRVGAMGFVWLLNSSVRVNDVSMTVEDKREMALRTLRELDALGQAVGFVFGVLIDVIEGAMDVSEGVKKSH